MRQVAPYTANGFARAIAMPNLSPPVKTLQECTAYHQQLAAAMAHCKPLMTLYLTDETKAQTIKEVKPDPNTYSIVFGAKLYPQHATTNTSAGVSDPLKLMPIFETMAKQQLPLLVHGEVADKNTDIYDREKVFIDQIFIPLRERIPSLKIVFEHITSKEAIAAVLNYDNTAATITPHHLHYNRSDLFDQGLHPHRYYLPLSKREDDRQALIEIACSGDSHFFAGTDSAPHTIDAKQSACGCAGIFNAPCAVETYTEIFEQMKKLKNLETFMSLNGARFYGLEPNTQKLTLVKQAWQMPAVIGTDAHRIIPFRAEETISWRILNKDYV